MAHRHITNVGLDIVLLQEHILKGDFCPTKYS